MTCNRPAMHANASSESNSLRQGTPTAIIGNYGQPYSAWQPLGQNLPPGFGLCPSEIWVMVSQRNCGVSHAGLMSDESKFNASCGSCGYPVLVGSIPPPHMSLLTCDLWAMRLKVEQMLLAGNSKQLILMNGCTLRTGWRSSEPK